MANFKFNYKRWYPLVKWVLVIVSIVFFVKQWTSADQESWKEIFKGAYDKKGVIILVLALMLFNWFIESTKFRMLLASSIRLSKVRAWLVVFSGTTISNFTPARTGDYIGRSLMIKEIAPVKVVLATVTGNLLQVLMTYVLGLLSFGYLLLYSPLGDALREYKQLLYISLGFTVLICAAIWLFPALFEKLKQGIPGKIKEGFQMIAEYPKKVVLSVGLLSLLRYVTFSLQFYLLLSVFTSEGLGLGELVYIPAAFLLQSLVPVPAVSDIGFRVYFSSLLFAHLLSEPEITMAVTSLWLINLILPAVIGAFYLLYSLVSGK